MKAKIENILPKIFTNMLDRMLLCNLEGQNEET